MRDVHYFYQIFFFQKSIPFAVIGSNTIVEVNGKRVRGRLYPWGVVEGNICTYTTSFLTYTNI